MRQRLNITNGDSAVGSLREAGVEGAIIPWRDVLHEGPVDASLPLEQLSKQRARFIAGNHWADIAQVDREFQERDRAIQNLSEVTEVVLWFEHDLYDQLQLLQLLDHFSNGARGSRSLSLVLSDRYLGPLGADDLRQLEASRTPASTEQLSLAKRAWNAFGSSDPTKIERLLQEDTAALPHLAAALKRHLEEFPSTVNGLSRSEREALTAISEGRVTPIAAFVEVAAKQESIFLGDSVFYSYVERLSGSDNPLVTWRDGSTVVAPTDATASDFVKREMMLTSLGLHVLAGEKDWQSISARTRWLGGVEIKPPSTWRWDPDARRVVRTARRPAPTSSRA